MGDVIKKCTPAIEELNTELLKYEKQITNRVYGSFTSKHCPRSIFQHLTSGSSAPMYLNVDEFTFIVNYNMSHTGKDGAEVCSHKLKCISILANCQVEDLKETSTFGCHIEGKS